MHYAARITKRNRTNCLALDRPLSLDPLVVLVLGSNRENSNKVQQFNSRRQTNRKNTLGKVEKKALMNLRRL